MRKHKSMFWIGTPALLFAGFLITSSPVRAAEAADSEQINKMLSDAKTMAFQLKEDAETMESFTRMDTSWQSHAIAINQIKDRVNALAKQVTKMKAAEGTAAPWQKTAIDRMTPYIDELTGYTMAVIEHVNHEVKHTPAEYKDYLEANADYASDLSAMISEFVDYGRAKQRTETLGSKLEVSVK